MARHRAREWQQLVQRWERSGLSAREFADRAGVAVKTLQWWRWHLREQARAAQGASLEAKVVTDTVATALVQVVPVGHGAACESEGETPIEIVFGDVVVRVRSGFDSVALGHVIDVLEGEESSLC